MVNFSDEILVSKIQAGDILAYEELVNKYQSIILKFVTRIVKDHAAAEDVTLETFYKVYTYIDKVDVNKKFSTFLFQVAKNKALDYLKSKKITVSLQDLELIDQSSSPEELLDQSLTRERVSLVLECLPAKYKKVVSLYYLDELSYKEISEKINLPLNTVRTHLRRAKSILKKELSYGS